MAESPQAPTGTPTGTPRPASTALAATGSYSALWTSSVQPQFPAAGKTTWLLNYVSGEIPDPLSKCPRAWRNRDNPFAATYSGGRTALRVCVVNAGIYGNAVFVIPLYPLRPHRSYTVTLKYAGKQQSHWTFKTRPSPPDEYNP
jgi:hypothetical protein